MCILHEFFADVVSLFSGKRGVFDHAHIVLRVPSRIIQQTLCFEVNEKRQLWYCGNDVLPQQNPRAFTVKCHP